MSSAARIMDDGAPSSVRELLDCPVCGNFMFPVYQCPRGHTICTHCKQRVGNQCPTFNCNEDMGNIRCSSLEMLAEMIDLPCKYHISGCREVLRGHEKKLSHELHECRFRRYRCPAPQCHLHGNFTTMVSHLAFDHKSDRLNGYMVEGRYHIELTMPLQWSGFWVISFKNCYFCLHTELEQAEGDGQMQTAFIRIVGDHNLARNFTCGLKVTGNRRKQSWQGVPSSILHSLKTVRESGDGLIVSRKMALFMQEERSELQLNACHQPFSILGKCATGLAALTSALQDRCCGMKLAQGMEKACSGSSGIAAASVDPTVSMNSVNSQLLEMQGQVEELKQKATHKEQLLRSMKLRGTQLWEQLDRAEAAKMDALQMELLRKDLQLQSLEQQLHDKDAMLEGLQNEIREQMEEDLEALDFGIAGFLIL